MLSAIMSKVKSIRPANCDGTRGLFIEFSDRDTDFTNYAMQIFIDEVFRVIGTILKLDDLRFGIDSKTNRQIGRRLGKSLIKTRHLFLPLPVAENLMVLLPAKLEELKNLPKTDENG